jgi:phosphate transport system substrate-binding protein
MGIMKRCISVAALVVVASLLIVTGLFASAARGTAPDLTLYGGGETLDPNATDRNDVFGYFASVVKGAHVAFCPVDGSFAKAAFIGTGSATGPCAPDAQEPTGLGAPAAVADFAGSAIPLSANDVTAFLADSPPGIATRGEPVQIPYVATSVALLYDNPDVRRGRLRLAIPTLCRIADGEITNWDRIPLDPTNPSGPTYPSRPLHFVYRSGASGATFSLSNFLSSRGADGSPTCARRGETFALGDTYVANVLPHPLPAGATARGFYGAVSDEAAVECITGQPDRCLRFRRTRVALGGPGTIGYVDPVRAFAAAIEPPLGIAELYVVRNGIGRDEDPIADLPGPATAIKSYEVDRVLAAFVPNGRPVPELIPLAIPPRKAGCLAVIPPSAYAFPAVGYPIVSIISADFASDGNGRKGDALRTLAALSNDGKNFAWKKIRTIDADNTARGERGASVLPLSTLRKSGIPNVAACIK